MQLSGAVAVSPLRSVRRAIGVTLLALGVTVSGVLAVAAPARATEPARLKAVFIVGPAGSQTAADLEDAEQLAVIAETYGMDVRRVFHPHATWEAVMANVQGANLVYYAGHGYGWPSPYTKLMTESRQNGVGLNTFDGSGTNQYTYYGANVIRANWVLAPNAIVFLNHLCYAAGVGEPGMADPSWDVARQRVDNFAAGFLAVGAKAVFALSYQRFNKILTSMLTTDASVEDLFRLPGTKPRGMFGWTGYDPRKFDSVRTTGAKSYLDPDPIDSFIRAVTGDLTLTARQWAEGTGGGVAPTLSSFAPQAERSVNPGGDMFTPNGDGVTDALPIKYAVDSEAFVDIRVKNGAGDVVRTMSSWSPGGQAATTWDGKRNDGSYVGEGTYTVEATPRNRQGTAGNTRRFDVSVFATMRSPTATPNLFYAADADNLARFANLSVTLERSATFWWKIADAKGNVVRTYVNGASADPGAMKWQWDGRDANGAFVPAGTYYSVVTAETAAGMYSHWIPIDAKAFRVNPAVSGPFARGTKYKFLIYSAEPLVKKPRFKVFAPGIAMKAYGTYNLAGGGYHVTITVPTTAKPGQVKVTVQGTDTGSQVQTTDYFYNFQ